MNVMILDDHPLVGCGLKSLVNTAFSDSMVYTETTVASAVNVARDISIDLSIVDLNLNGESGFEFLRKCKDEAYGCKCMVLTSSVYSGDFKKAMEIGVDGYLLKESMPEDLIYALKVVKQGRKFIDPHFMSDQFSSSSTDKSGQLTEREKEILIHVGKGLTNTEISKKLFISVSTVKKHINHIFSKMEFRNRGDAILYCNQSM